MQVSDHINAEIVAGTIASKQDAIGYFTWTFYYRRLLVNPSYYALTGTSPEELSEFLSALVERVLTSLWVSSAFCTRKRNIDSFPQKKNHTK